MSEQPSWRRPGFLGALRFGADTERTSNRFSYLLLAIIAASSFFIQNWISGLAEGWAKLAGVVIALLGAIAVFLVLRTTRWTDRRVRGRIQLRPLALSGLWLVGLAVSSLLVWLWSRWLPDVDVVVLCYPISCVIIGGIYGWAGLASGSHKDLFLGLWLVGIGLIGAALPMPNMLLIIGGASVLGFLAAAWPSRPRASDDSPPRSPAEGP